MGFELKFSIILHRLFGFRHTRVAKVANAAQNFVQSIDLISYFGHRRRSSPEYVMLSFDAQYLRHCGTKQKDGFGVELGHEGFI